MFPSHDLYTLSSYSFTDTDKEEYVYRAGVWKSVNNDGNLNFIVAQVGNTVYFYDVGSESLSEGEKSFSIDLDSYLSPSAVTSRDTTISISTGQGALFISSPAIEPLLVEYDEVTDSITVTEIEIKIRDFAGVDDGLELTEEPVTLSKAHEYNLKNQGWESSATGDKWYNDYKSDAGVYPPNSLSWWMAKETNGDIDVSELRKLAIGTTEAPKGHFILNLFNQDRNTASGLTTVPSTVINQRPSSIAFFAGRVCYGLNNSVYISELLRPDRSNAGVCYQVADPTSEEISDLVDTDGVVVEIPEIGSILSLFSLSNSLVVFANNGVWSIGGTDGFKATDFSVTKITSDGIIAPASIVDVEGTPFWFSTTSILRLSVDSVSQLPIAENVSDERIKTFYNDIDSTDLEKAQGVYDSLNRRILWIYKDNGTAPSGTPNAYAHKILLLDTRLGSFYPWEVSSIETESPFMASIFQVPFLSKTERTFGVVNGADNIVNGADEVVYTGAQNTSSNKEIKVMVVVHNCGS